MALEVKVIAQEMSPGLTLVTYTASTGASWRVYDPHIIGHRGTMISSVTGQALVGTTGAALFLNDAPRPRGVSADELRAAIFAAEHERRRLTSATE